MIPWYEYLLLPIIGLAAGFLNVIAGGGGFIQIPALIYIFNLPPQIANATSRLTVCCVNATSMTIFHKHDQLELQYIKRPFIPTIIGAIIGALTAAVLSPKAFELLFGLVMIGIAIFLITNPKRLTASNRNVLHKPKLEYLAYFAIGIYCGFIQAGGAILLLIALSFFRTPHLVKATAAKNMLTFFITLFPTLIFAYFQQIDYAKGLLLLIGAIPGSFLGVKFSISKGATFIFYIIIIIALLTGLDLTISTIIDFLTNHAK
ncbi:sulfite exporter TauE/SafE family protein [Planctomycetota bacterium]|nr:sulfite exporter TauE/SafE family protein [Planctomycetota bacterium]